jgi:NAD(P)-dependent dehydrogenase (short-subunit alcohol dehydrogenase family)
VGRLDGEVALITGSTSGLGKTIATLFAEEGARVVVTGRDETRGRAAVDAITAAGGTAAFAPADLTDDEQVSTLVDLAEQAFGPLTVLVNNAVLGARDNVHDGPAADVALSSFDAVMSVDARSVLALSQRAIRSMRSAGRGSIVNISSRAAARGTPRLAAYTAAKAAMEALARSITIDHGREGIRCNNVRPGYILHETRDADLAPDRRARLEAMQITRLPTARDVAYAVLFLASRESEVITGITLPVDGGSTVVRAATIG